MTPNIQEWVKQRVPRDCGKVLEIGALNINGGVRSFFTNASPYIGIDIQYGPGVDMALNGHDICRVWGDNTFDTVVCLETLEHDNMFWETAINIGRVLRPGGTLFLSMPSIGFPYHYAPDHYRFTESGLRNVFAIAQCDVRELTTLKDTAGYDGVIGYGKRI